MTYLAVAIGGALGATARYGFGVLAVRYAGTALPWGTLGVNLLGSFVIGILGTLAIEFATFSNTQRQFLIAGVLGGFTTFSSLSFEVHAYARDGLYWKATLYLGLTLAAGLAAVALGSAIAREMRG